MTFVSGAVFAEPETHMDRAITDRGKSTKILEKDQTQ
jgi:hypothetical protein